MGTLQSFIHASIFCHTNDLVGCDLLCVHKILYRVLIHIPTPREVENTFLEYLFPRYVIRQSMNFRMLVYWPRITISLSELMGGGV